MRHAFQPVPNNRSFAENRLANLALNAGYKRSFVTAVAYLSVGVMFGCGPEKVRHEDRPKDHPSRDELPSNSSLAVVLTTFIEVPPDPKDLSDVKVLASQLERVRSYFVTASRGKLVFGGKDDAGIPADILGPVSIHVPTVCDHAAIQAELDAEIRDAGHADTSAYDFSVMIVPMPPIEKNVCEIPAGRAFSEKFVAATSWAPFGGTPDSSTLIHEMAHSLGLQKRGQFLPHANGFTCRDASGQTVRYSSNCQSEEYQDITDVMGNGGGEWAPSFQPEYLLRLGWLDPAQVQTVSSSGTFELTAVENRSDSSIVLLKIPGNGSEQFLVEYRHFEKETFSAHGKGLLPSGVYIKYMGYPEDSTQLLDMKPDDKKFYDAFDDAALPLGETFTHPTLGFKITYASVSEANSNATVQVVFP